MAAQKVIVSAIQPTRKITIGNYIGAIRNWVQLQQQYKCYFFAVDLHSLTLRQDPKELQENTLYAIATYLACGLDPKYCTLFVQSHVTQHSELAWVLGCYGYMGELNRMTQFKEKSQKSGENIPLGIFTYPILMASDILLYSANLVPVGADQKQHIELTRDVAERMNGIYGKDTFVIPEPFIPKVGGRIMDLQDPTSKMSKSAESDVGVLFLDDSPKDIEKKVKRAVTDSGSGIEYVDSKPGVKNLLEIQSSLSGKSIDALVKEYSGKQYGHLKVSVAETVIDFLKPIQEATQKRLKDRGELLRSLKSAADEARVVAEKTMQRVRERVGFVPRS